MHRDEERHVPVVRLESEVGTAVQRHLAVRVEWVVGAMAPTFAGKPVDDVAAEMQARLRALGVTLPVRQLQGYARTIANLPPAGGSSAA